MAALLTPTSSFDATRRWLDPAFFDFWATRLNPLWTWERPRARLIARREEGEGAVTLLLQANRHWRGVAPGQHVELGVQLQGTWLRRHYSPTVIAPGRLEITVKTQAGGRVSPHLAQHARIGEVFELGQGFGDFRWPHGNAPVLMLAAGSGITPMRALLRAQAERGLDRDITLMYWTRRREEACFAQELLALAHAHPRLRVQLHVTGEGAARVDALTPSYWPALEGTQVLACGPGGFVQAARARVAEQAAGYEAEAFSAPEQTLAEDGEVEVVLARSGRTLRLPRAVSLLEGLEAHGLKPRHGCRMGICNTCVCQRQSGATRHLLSGQRHDEPAAPVRLCVQAPSTDLILEL
ncbi:ferredoxin reductase [Stenotrophomonas sp. HITSZ_GD]|uniref:ferredoxin reductase n=1 Tax=Stenotrophomonas sp. HITSZ_GD TaxID=3037248 RepID=UPI00240E4E54|nr:ferredoxin reductase [Stenotrophomonas sp. HITSZ_GD]MDG2525288.1 ferredoxin reductase [Stenotrophomonas sp. HITSZ_GD]